LVISFKGTPWLAALEVEADLVEWPLKVEVSIPDKERTLTSHREIVHVFTG